MSKYRKKPVVIEAFLFAESSEPAPWFFKACENGNVIVVRNCMAEYGERLRCKIKTLEGVMTAQEGDYIIRGVHGEIYPCKADIFEKTYEKVTDDE